MVSVLMNYLTANTKPGFSSLRDGDDGRGDGLSKGETLPSAAS